ncbi:MAG: biopolymer transporter ExbD [Victivallaceae bacterium]|nr:biopolymer transporter ExbD [Victivallaceae bacterium]
MRHHKRARSQMAAIDQINVTPLLDLTFLLLIAFMITMPLMEYGTQISAPEMNSGDLPTENFGSVTLTKSGTIMLGNETLSREEMLDRIRRMKSDNPKLELLLRADGSRSYQDVIELMADIRRSGFDDVTLVTQAEGK